MSLHGFRVIDLTRVISGPFCTQQLADLGADVIKVETPAGDTLRGQGSMVGETSAYFASFNRNKRSIVLDLRSEDGMAVLRELIAGADVLVDNFKPGTMARMGLSDAALAALNPRLIACHISGFGQSGPYADRPAFDFVAQAMSGFMWTNGDPDGPPLRSGIPISDLAAGLYAALGIAAALAVPRETRRFKSIDVAMADSMVSLLAYMATEVFATGQPLPRAGNDHPLVAPYGLFETSDGHIAIAPSNDVMVERLFATLGCRDLLDDPRFAGNAARMRHRAAINAEVEARLRAGTTDDWIARLNSAGVPAGPVQTVEQALLSDPQIAHRDMALATETPDGEPMKILGFPIKQSGNGPELRRIAPRLGEHTDAILRELEEARRNKKG
ncbi:CoA transferase [Marivita sp. GX14005]|uniref:CaiB/BaiF CoA transferase family protein n=1 Tax=Marivita sp. GX14005 TaxID=2942276 RepID=UPI002018DD2D|nr:CoA transferase [Marivita sp. GX14005]MCL3883274.1 CoA transferase [Marivita sp. GX14005]